MNMDQAIGVIMLIGSLFGVALYFYLVFLSLWTSLVMQQSAFGAVTAVLFITAWIVYTLGHHASATAD